MLRLYDLFKRYPLFAWGLFLASTTALVLSFLRLGYKEDISDFLPLDEKNHTAMSVYQDISGADKIYAVISTRDTTYTDPQELADGVEAFAASIERLDSIGFLSSVIKEIDMEKMLGVTDFIYENIPFCRTDRDYGRLDSLRSHQGYIDGRIREVKKWLLSA